MDQISSHKTSVQSFVVRSAGLALTWAVFTDLSVLSWLVGIPVIAAALILPRYFPALPSFRIHPLGTFKFLIYFFVKSFFGGIDVAWRAFHPQCPLAPELCRYRLRLKNEFAVMFFANTISLLPGTLTINVTPQEITLHVLDSRQDVIGGLQLLEEKVAGIFYEEIRHE